MKGKRSLANIQLRGTIPLNNGLFFALDDKGDGRLHDNSRFHGYTQTWFANARGECWRARVFGNLPDKTVLCDSQLDAVLTMIRLAQTKSKPPTVKEEPPPFGAVRFDGTREFDGATNQDRAELGKQLVALSYILSAREKGWMTLSALADTINLDEVPEFPLTEALLAVQHYAHRDYIVLYGEDGAWALAQKQFNDQSGGAAL